MNKLIRHPRSLLAIIVAGATLAAWVSTSSAHSSSSSARTLAVHTVRADLRSASAKKSITLAIVADETGFFAVNTGLDGALAYIDKVNSTGGVDGYKIKVSQFDSQSTPAGALQATRHALSLHPTALLTASIGMSSAIPTLAATGIPAVGEGFAPGWVGHPTLFSPLGDISAHISDSWLVALKEQGETRIALLTSPLEAPVTNQLAAEASSAGVKIVLKNESLAEVLSSASALAVSQQIKSSGADGVVIFGLVGGALVQGNLSSLGDKAKVIETSEIGPSVIKQFGASANGMEFGGVFTQPYVKYNPGVTQFIATMKKFGFSSQTYSPYAILRYDQARMLIDQGLAVAGAPFKAKAIVKALSQVDNYTADGLLPPVSFPLFQKSGSPCLSVSEIVNGKWVGLKSGPLPFICGGPSEPVS